MRGIRVTRPFLPPLTFKDQILTLDAADLSTQVADCADCTFTARPFNFADLHGPIPASVYFGGTRKQSALFNGRWQSVIVEGNYWPSLLLPRQITSVAPDLFASCPARYKLVYIDVDHNNTASIRNRRAAAWDPPVALQPITKTVDSPPLPVITGKSPPPSAVLAGEPYPFLHTAASTSGNPHPTGDFPEPADSHNAAGSSGNSPTVTSRTTSSALPDSLRVRMGSQSILVGGPALTLEGTVISRALNGDYVIESRISDLRSGTDGQPSPTRTKGARTGDETLGIQTSGINRTTERFSWWRWICAVSFVILI
jgi:hypothetical protein